MAYEKKDGDITLGFNQRSKDTHPAMRGSIRMNGKDYEIALWERQGKNGPFYTGSVGKEVQEGGFGQRQTSFPPRREAAPQPKQQDAFNDDVPWDT